MSLLGEIGLGVIVVGRDRRPVFVNAVAQGFIGDGFLLDGRGLTAADAAVDSSLSEALDAVLTAPPTLFVAAPIAVARPSGRKPLILQIMRLNARNSADGPAAMLIVTDPQRGTRDPLRSLQLLGLTPAEARIAALVGSGLSPREAGEMAGNTEGTVRNMLKQVYDKLDIGRQSELARLVTRLETVAVVP